MKNLIKGGLGCFLDLIKFVVMILWYILAIAFVSAMIFLIYNAENLFGM